LLNCIQTLAREAAEAKAAKEASPQRAASPAKSKGKSPKAK
jgi:hypothetical protein